MSQLVAFVIASVAKQSRGLAQSLWIASRIQIIRYVVLPHIGKVLFPPLSNQYIILTMTTSIAAIFGVEELTGRTYNINAQTFRSFEIFSIAALYYIALTLVASAALYAVGRYFFRIKGRVF